MEPGHARLFNGLSHHRVGNAGQLKIELKSGDPLFSSSELAIHVAESVFPADDVGQQFISGYFMVVVVGSAETDANPADGPSHGDASVHHRKATPAN